MTTEDQKEANSSATLADIGVVEAKFVPDKDEWAASGKPFFIIDIAFRAVTNFGPEWQYTIVADDGAIWKIGLGDGDGRRERAEKMVEGLKIHRRLGPVRLAKLALPDGKSMYIIKDVKLATAAPQSPPPAAPVAPKAPAAPPPAGALPVEVAPVDDPSDEVAF